MKTLCLFTLLAVAKADPCPRQPLTNFYRDLGCEGIFEDGSECPTSFNCDKHERRDKSKCYFKGVAYNVGENIGNVDCHANCFCDGLRKNEPSITCANVECPELFEGRVEEGCYYAYKPWDCCKEKTVCTDKESPKTCVHNNSTFYEGQQFYPTENTCQECICMNSAPFCREIKCNEQLHSGERINEGCVPIYYGVNRCCPIDWRCPENGDAVVKKLAKESTKTKRKCVFGELVLEPGESLKGSGNVECSCQVPPYLTCISQPV